MKVVSKVSSRMNKEGQPYNDFYAVWTYNGKDYEVRVRPCFDRDYKLLISQLRLDAASKDKMPTK